MGFRSCTVLARHVVISCRSCGEEVRRSRRSATPASTRHRPLPTLGWQNRPVIGAACAPGRALLDRRGPPRPRPGEWFPADWSAVCASINPTLFYSQSSGRDASWSRPNRQCSRTIRCWTRPPRVPSRGRDAERGPSRHVRGRDACRYCERLRATPAALCYTSRRCQAAPADVLELGLVLVTTTRIRRLPIRLCPRDRIRSHRWLFARTRSLVRE